MSKNYVKFNEEAWDYRAENNDCWSMPVSSEEVDLARKGEWEIVLTPTKKVPRSWFPAELEGKKVLCLASGGGQQGPIIAATGAKVTVFDNSIGQLKKDQYVALRDKLEIKTVQGDMGDLSIFEDEYFDLIVHPWSNSYVDNILLVWKEAARVLKKGGIMLSGFSNGFEYIFDSLKLEKGLLEAKYKLPYSDLEALTAEEFEVICKNEGVCFGHTLADQIGGQIEAGFIIAGFYEDIGGTELDNYVNTSIGTKAIKL